MTDRPLETSSANTDKHTGAAPVEQVIDTSDDTDSEQVSSTHTDRNVDFDQYLREPNISAIPVRGGGHCLSCAFKSSLYAAEQKEFTVEDLGKLLLDEIRTNHFTGTML